METGDLLLFGTFLHADQRLLAGGNQRSLRALDCEHLELAHGERSP